MSTHEFVEYKVQQIVRYALVKETRRYSDSSYHCLVDHKQDEVAEFKTREEAASLLSQMSPQSPLTIDPILVAVDANEDFEKVKEATLKAIGEHITPDDFLMYSPGTRSFQFMKL